MVTNEGKQIMNSSLRFLIVASLSLEYKEVLQCLTWCTHQVLNHSKWTQNEKDMGGTREGSIAIFSKKLKRTITHPLPEFSVLLLYF